jgi:hypothetical protein
LTIIIIPCSLVFKIVETEFIGRMKISNFAFDELTVAPKKVSQFFSLIFLKIKKVISLNFATFNTCNGAPRIRHQYRKTAVLSCHRFLISSGV